MTRYGLVVGVLHADLEGEEILLNPDRGVYHLVNRTGRRLIAEMEAGRSFEEAVRSLSEETGEPYDRTERDARSFVDAMLRRTLLEAVES